MEPRTCPIAIGKDEIIFLLVIKSPHSPGVHQDDCRPNSESFCVIESL
jgi:hypothetical protein